ncbi:MAG: hypothetical protein ACKO3B_07355 [Bacteroidota bacterium]
MDDMLQAHTHDQIFRLGQRCVFNCRFQSSDKLPFICLQVGIRLNSEFRRKNGGGMQSIPFKGGLTVNDNTPQLMLHAGLGGRDQQSEFALKASAIRKLPVGFECKIIYGVSIQNELTGADRMRLSVVHFWKCDDFS